MCAILERFQFGEPMRRHHWISERNKFHIHVPGMGPIMLMFASGIVGNSEAGVYAGWKCCLSWSWQSIIRARGRLFQNAPTRARDSFPNAPTRARDSFYQCSKSRLRLAFECSNSSTNDRQFEGCVFGWVFFTKIITFCHSMPFMSMY